MPQIFQPLFAKNARTINTTQSINPVNAVVISTSGRLNHEAKARWKVTETKYPPNIAAVILEKRGQKDGFKYFGFAGIGQL